MRLSDADRRNENIFSTIGLFIGQLPFTCSLIKVTISLEISRSSITINTSSRLWKRQLSVSGLFNFNPHKRWGTKRRVQFLFDWELWLGQFYISELIMWSYRACYKSETFDIYIQLKKRCHVHYCSKNRNVGFTIVATIVWFHIENIFVVYMAQHNLWYMSI